MPTKFRIARSIALSSIFGSLFLATPHTAHAAWSPGTVVVAENIGPYWLTLDSNGKPHFSYRTSSRGIVYGWNTTGTWGTEQVDSDTNMYDPVLGLNQNNEPRMVYVHRYVSRAADEGMVYHRKKTGSSWGSAVSVTPVPNYMDLAGFHRRNEDLFRIAYFKKDSLRGTAMTEFHYSRQDNIASWGSSNITLDTNGGAGFGTAVASNPDYDATAIFREPSGKIHFAYYDRSSAGPRIRYMTANDDGSSPTAPETIDTNVNTGGMYRYQVSLMVDNGGIAHAAYSAGTTNPYSIRYAARTAGSWTTEIATAAANFGLGHVHITTDTAGHPVIAYEFQRDSFHGSAAFAHKVCGNWTSFVAPPSHPLDADEGYSIKVAISQAGEHHFIHGRALSGDAVAATIYHTWVDSYTPTAIADLSHNWTTGLNIPISWSSPADKDSDNNSQALPDGSLFRVMYTASADKAAGVWDPNTTDPDFTKVDVSTGCLNANTSVGTTITVPSQGTYYVRVFTRDEYPLNWSPVSNELTVAMDTVAPAPVTDLTGQSSSLGAAVDLTWHAPGNDGDQGTLTSGSAFIIQYTTAQADAENGSFWSPAAAQVSISTSGVNPGDWQAAAVTGLPLSATYYFRLWTSDGANISALSNGATAWAEADELSPSATTDLTAAPSGTAGYIRLSWSTQGDDGSSGALQPGSEYRIQWTTSLTDAQNPAFWSETSAQISISTSGVSYPDQQTYLHGPSLNEATPYYYRLWTKDEASNWSPLSNGATAQATPTPPNAVSDLALTQGSYPGELTASWTAPGDDGNTGDNISPPAYYTVKYATYSASGDAAAWWASATTLSSVTTVKTRTSAESYTVPGFIPGTTYYFALKTTDDAGAVSDISNEAFAWAAWPMADMTFYLTAITPSGTFPSGSKAMRLSAPGSSDLTSIVAPTVSGAGSYRVLPGQSNSVNLGGNCSSLPATVSGQAWISDQDTANRILNGGTWNLKMGYKAAKVNGSVFTGNICVRLSKVTVTSSSATLKTTLLPWTAGPAISYTTALTYVSADFGLSVSSVAFAADEYLLAEYAVAFLTNNKTNNKVYFEVGTTDNMVQTNGEYEGLYGEQAATASALETMSPKIIQWVSPTGQVFVTYQ